MALLCFDYVEESITNSTLARKSADFDVHLTPMISKDMLEWFQQGLEGYEQAYHYLAVHEKLLTDTFVLIQADGQADESYVNDIGTSYLKSIKQCGIHLRKYLKIQKKKIEISLETEIWQEHVNMDDASLVREISDKNAACVQSFIVNANDGDLDRKDNDINNWPVSGDLRDCFVAVPNLSKILAVIYPFRGASGRGRSINQHTLKPADQIDRVGINLERFLGLISKAFQPFFFTIQRWKRK